MRFCGEWFGFFSTNGFAGGGSRQFNHFHAELATGQICSFLTELTVGKAKVVRPEQIRLLLERATRFAAAENCVAKKRCVLLGCHTDSILLRKIWEQGRNSYT